MKKSLIDYYLRSGAPSEYALHRFSVNYNTSDFSYLTSAAFSDTSSFLTSDVIRVATAATPDTNFVTGVFYLYASDPADERIFFKRADTGSPLAIWDNTWSEIGEIGSGYGQGNCVDPVNERIYSYQTDGTVDVTDLSGSAIETLTAPAIAGNIHWWYDYKNELFYVCYQASINPIEVWSRSGSALSVAETKWYEGRQGICGDTVLNKIFVINDTTSNLRFREQTFDGLSGITLHNKPITNGWVAEQMAVAPDGTYYATDPSGYHSSIVGGNRLWHLDPRQVYRKYDRSPSMTRFSRFSGGTLAGNLDTQTITQSVGQKIYSPIYDTNTFTNTENTSAWAFEFESGGDADITFRGSDTAPDGGSAVTNYYSDMPQYSAGAWGTTVPSAEQGTPGTYRYKQAILTVKSAAASSTITIQDLIDTISPQILLIQHDSEKMYVYTDQNQEIPLIVNQATPTNNFTQSTASNRFRMGADYAHDYANLAAEIMEDESLIASDTQGQLVSVCRREVNTTRNTIFAGTASGANNRLLFWHDTTANGDDLRIEETNGSGTVINAVSASLAGTAYARLDFISNGTAWDIKVNGSSQSLTVDTGANNGNWFGDLGATITQGLQGNSTSKAGQGRFRLTLYKSSPLTSAMDTLLDNYITQEGMI